MSAERPITEDDLHAYVDVALDPARREEVAAYLDRHPDIATRIAGYTAQRAMLRDALAPIAEAPVPPHLSLARLIEAHRRPAFPLVRSWLAAAAAIVLIVLGGAGGWTLRGAAEPPRNGLMALGREAADSYAVYAPDRAHPVEMAAADQANLVRWVSNRLHRPVSVPDLSPSGFHFMGGRLVATPHGPAALFLYDDDQGARIAMLVRSMPNQGTAPMKPCSYGSLAGYVWAGQGLGYSLVADAPHTQLHPLANEARRQLSLED